MSADRTKQRVVVADDDVLLREGVAGLLERSGFEIVGQAGDGTELLRVVRDQAPELFVSLNTIRTHLRNVYLKLGVHSRANAVTRARELGLLSPSSLKR